jgi:hypothetical protein
MNGSTIWDERLDNIGRQALESSLESGDCRAEIKFHMAVQLSLTGHGV